MKLCLCGVRGWGKIRSGIGTWNFLWLCCAQALRYFDDLNTRTLATTNWAKWADDYVSLQPSFGYHVWSVRFCKRVLLPHIRLGRNMY